MSEPLEENGLVPKLRFPEFREPWCASVLDGIADVNPRTTLTLPDQFRYIDLESVENGKLHQTRIEHRATAPSRAQRIVACGDILFQTVRPYQKNNLLFSVNDSNVYVASTGYAQIRAKGSAAFLYYLLETDDFQRAVQRRCSGSNYPAIAPSDLANISVGWPPISEQQKIGECLESLDELIAAEAEKLDALKRHKKGLLQQLFPAEGETIPRLRFHKFRDAGEWNYRMLEELAENLDNCRVPISSNERVPGATPYYGASGIVDYVDGYLFDETLLCVSEDGANLVARNTPIAFTIQGRTWVNNHAHVLKFAERHVHLLVEAYLNEMDLRDFLTGMAQPKLNRGMLDTIAIPLPSSQEETRSVAEAINSVDVGVAESAKQLKALRHHKAALMQQLFPTIDEMEA